MIRAGELTKKYYFQGGFILATDRVSFEVEEGQFAVVMGPSGCGKTTLLTLIGLLQRPDSGEIFLDGEPVVSLPESKKVRIRSHKIGFVFQNYNLIGYLTAVDNVKLAQTIAGNDISNGRAEKALAKVGLEKRVDHLPSQLSGGQQQRVAIARALVNNPKIILADEPTGNLDSKVGKEIIALLRNLCRKENKTLLIVTHEQELVKEADIIFRMKDGKLQKG